MNAHAAGSRLFRVVGPTGEDVCVAAVNWLDAVGLALSDGDALPPMRCMAFRREDDGSYRVDDIDGGRSYTVVELGPARWSSLSA